MGGVDTRNRYHVHWGAAEQYAERREESALRRSGRPVPDAAFEPFARIDLAPLDAILARARATGPRSALRILEETQDAYGHLPVAALQHIALQTGAWYSELYGIATSYPHLRFETPTAPPRRRSAAARQCTRAGRWRACWRRSGSTSATDVGGVSPDGAVRLEATDCRGESRGTPRVIVDGSVLPRATRRRTPRPSRRRCARTVAQGRPA